jgi:hypothetical protein
MIFLSSPISRLDGVGCCGTGQKLRRCSDNVFRHFPAGQAKVTQAIGVIREMTRANLYGATDASLSLTCVELPTDQFSYCRSKGASRR